MLAARPKDWQYQRPLTLDPTKRRRKRTTILACFILMAALVGGGYYLFSATAKSDPSSVTLPPAAAELERETLVSFFANDGAPLLAFKNALATDLDNQLADQCEPLTTRLQAAGSPRLLQELADAIPTSSVRDGFRALLTATLRLVSECVSESAITSPTSDTVDFQSRIVDRLLQQNGITQ